MFLNPKLSQSWNEHMASFLEKFYATPTKVAVSVADIDAFNMVLSAEKERVEGLIKKQNVSKNIYMSMAVLMLAVVYVFFFIIHDHQLMAIATFSLMYVMAFLLKVKNNLNEYNDMLEFISFHDDLFKPLKDNQQNYKKFVKRVQMFQVASVFFQKIKMEKRELMNIDYLILNEFMKKKACSM